VKCWVRNIRRGVCGVVGREIVGGKRVGPLRTIPSSGDNWGMDVTDEADCSFQANTINIFGI